MIVRRLAEREFHRVERYVNDRRRPSGLRYDERIDRECWRLATEGKNNDQN